MPFLQIFTNVSRSRLVENFGPLLAKIVSENMRNKPVDRVMVQVATDQYLSLGTTDNIPIALVILQSIGSMDLDDNRKTINAVTKFINENLNIESSNIKMVFRNQSIETIGSNGKLFCDLMPRN